MKNLLATLLIFSFGIFHTSYGAMILPIKDVFSGKCISENGCRKLDEIIDKFDNDTILIEVYCTTKLDYDYTWELANIYAYKVTKCLIEKGYDQNKIRYIGFGSLDIEKPDNKNIIKISKQEIEDLKRPD